ncbi:hypothetical protein O2K51_13825 [Apibacter raozihei]|uniref:hypothetical protein n=1 Tax=Apibacter raozihei TaxID=2500547 RepID=UPI000FE2EE1C|nr:hypothetical protein [Apibacter raozihei]
MKPYYVIKFNAVACMFEVRINDISVLTINIEGQASSIVPINFAIPKSGEQTISVHLLPITGTTNLNPEAELKVEISLYEISHKFDFKEKVWEYSFPSIKKEQIIPVLTYTSVFQAAVPYSFDGWTTGENLKEMENVKSKLIDAYNRLTQIINNGEYELFKQKIATRENSMRTSMYLSNEKSEKRISDLINDFQSGFKVQPIPSDAIYMSYGFDKAAALKKTNGESALYLINYETREELMLDLLFYIPKGKTEFEVI